MQCACVKLSPAVRYFSTLSNKRPMFEEKFTNMNVCFDFLYNFCLKRLSVNKVFSGRQPRQSVKFLQRFRDWLRPHLQGVADGLVEVHQTRVAFWRLGRSQSLKRSRTFTLWRGTLPQKVLLNSVAAKASRLLTFIILRKNKRDMITKIALLLYKVPVILVKF